MHLVGFMIRFYHDARSDERQTCQKFRPIKKAALCCLGLTQPGLDQVSALCKYSSTGYSIGTHKNTLLPKFSSQVCAHK